MNHIMVLMDKVYNYIYSSGLIKQGPLISKKSHNMSMYSKEPMHDPFSQTWNVQKHNKTLRNYGVQQTSRAKEFGAKNDHKFIQNLDLWDKLVGFELEPHLLAPKNTFIILKLHNNGRKGSNWTNEARVRVKDDLKGRRLPNDLNIQRHHL